MPKKPVALPSQAELTTLLNYDPLTGELTWRPRSPHQFPNGLGCASFNARFANQPAFTSCDSKGYRMGRVKGINFKAHRIIWKMFYGYDPDTVDHVDGNKTNNVISNLRDVTVGENLKNQPVTCRNSSGVVGVSWVSKRNKWTASIGYKSKAKFLGYFEDFDDAVAARKNAEVVYDYHLNHGVRHA